MEGQKPFVGQIELQRIFKDLVKEIPFELMVETGTYYGATTRFITEVSGLPTYSSEINVEYADHAYNDLADVKPRPNVIQCDSRELIKRLALRRAGLKTFFFLDAHWPGCELPLVPELDMIAANWKQFVVMIHDFKIPDDPGYGFDDYGNQGQIGMEMINPVVEKYNLPVFFPSSKSGDNNWPARGTAYLCSRDLVGTLAKISSLRQIRS